MAGVGVAAKPVEAQKGGQGEGHGKWYVEIGSVSGSAISLTMESRAGPTGEPFEPLGTLPGPRVEVRFEGPDAKTVTWGPGVGDPVSFSEPGTYRAAAKPHKAGDSAYGTIEVRGPNPFTLTGER